MADKQGSVSFVFILRQSEISLSLEVAGSGARYKRRLRAAKRESSQILTIWRM